MNHITEKEIQDMLEIVLRDSEDFPSELMGAEILPSLNYEAGVLIRFKNAQEFRISVDQLV